MKADVEIACYDLEDIKLLSELRAVFTLHNFFKLAKLKITSKNNKRGRAKQ